ncbi:MAG TPA: ATP-binding protein [Stellaceae bacterium]|nr:ATP-binding protein [Stellaceae bacterium]
MVSDINALVGSLLVPALAIDEHGRITSVNDALTDCLELAASELVGSKLAGRIVDASALADFLATAAGPREFRFDTGKAGVRDLALSLLVRAPAGAVALTAFDLTARRIAESALQEEITRYRDMTTAASDWYFELDRTMTRMRLVRRHAASGDVTLVEQRSRWPHEFIDVTYDPDAFAEVIRKMAAHEVVRDYVHRLANADGKERYLRSSCTPFFDQGRQFQGYRGVSVDVTAQVLAERALRDSEGRLRHSQQHLERAQRVAATGSAERDLVSGSEEWSDEMFHLLGLERASFALTDAVIFSLVHEEDRERIKAAIAMSRQGKPPPPGEFRIVRPDGETLTLYWETEVLCDAKGVPIRSTSVFKDVTELRAAERREREMERQLLHLQKLEALGTLAGGVAHDLNNTLVPILALTKLTANRLPAESRERSNLVTVMEACERARSLVQRILAFSRKQNSEKRAFDLAATVREALRMLRASLPATVQIIERVADVPSFFGDSSQLHQVLVNLVTNAAQAIGTAMGTITVELRQDRDVGLCLAVSDTGCGMDEATAARIFEPFFTTKDVGQGTGLGLSLVHGIVSSHGGRIKMTSRVGEGTIFEICLPLSPSAAQTHKSIEEARAAKYRSIPAAPAPSRVARKPATAARSR